MTARTMPPRRRSPRRVPSCRVQAGTAARGAVVAAGLAAAVALQVAGPRLQCRLADLVGVSSLAPSAAPAVVPASMPSCSSPSGSGAMHSCKVAMAWSADSAGNAPIL